MGGFGHAVVVRLRSTLSPRFDRARKPSLRAHFARWFWKSLVLSLAIVAPLVLLGRPEPVRAASLAASVAVRLSMSTRPRLMTNDL